MKVIFVGAGPGDPELLTLKAQRILTKAQCCIYAGSLISPVILEALPTSCHTYDSAEMSLDDILEVVSACQQTNTDVIRLHTGEPTIFGAIAEQMRALDKLGIEYSVIPGISSFQAAAAAINAELTAPNIAQTIILSRIAGRTPVPDEQNLEQLAATRSTLCLFLSIQQIAKISQQLIPYYGNNCPIAVVYHASWQDQQVIIGTLFNITEKVKQAKITRTAIILVGQALDKQGDDSKLYDAYFSHGYRKGKNVA